MALITNVGASWKSSYETLLLVPSRMTSRVPLIGTVRKLRQSISRSRRFSANSDVSDDSIDVSGTTTPTLTRPLSPEELSITRLDAACQHSAAIQMCHQHRGVNWEAAIIGHQMLTSACERTTGSDTTMSRALYIDAIKYLHNGLPKDLHGDEMRTLRSSLPINLQEQELMQREAPPQRAARATPKQNMIRSSTASLVTSTVALFMLLLPIVATLLNKALQYERQHHLTERAIQGAKSAGSAGVHLGDQALRLIQSPLGIWCVLRLGWLAQSICEGVNDGLETSLSERLSLPQKKIDQRI